MVNKYLMFVDERGFNDSDKNFYMIGVVFKDNYCTDLENIDSELKIKINQYKSGIFSSDLKNISLEDLFFYNIGSKNVMKEELQEFVNKLPILFKYLKFDIIISSVNQKEKSLNSVYRSVASDLLGKFYQLIEENKGDCGSIIIDGTHVKKGVIRQQRFFNIYNERKRNLNNLKDVEDRINSFIVTDLNNEKYGLALSIANILSNIVYRGYGKLKEENIEDRKMFEAVKKKFVEEDNLSANNSEELYYSEIEKLIKEIDELKEKLNVRNFKIENKEKEIESLTAEIRVLENKLEKIILGKTSDNIISEILSDAEEEMVQKKKSVNVIHS